MNYTTCTFDADNLEDKDFLINALIKILHDYKVNYKEFPNHILIGYDNTGFVENKITIIAKNNANQKEILVIEDIR